MSPEHLLENTLEHEGVRFLILSRDRTFIPEGKSEYHAFIIEGGNPAFTHYIIRLIRSHNDPDVYLKPMFLLSGSDHKDVLVHNLIDGVVFTRDQIPFLVDRVSELRMKLNQITHPTSISFEAKIINKTLQLLYTRDKESMDAIPYFHSGIGYFYPEMSVQFKAHDESEVLRILKISEEEGHFKTSFNQRVYLCTNCSGGYLNYREVCPKCNSSNSDAEDLVHHFPCAYVGLVSDFENTIDDELNCPKCNKTLRHIGVDYDKPSMLHTCKSCSHKYQDFNVKALCLLCGHDNEVDKLIPKAIYDYKLTKKGETLAVHGYINTNTDFVDIPGTVSFDVFKTMLKYEIERLKQNDSTSNIAYLHLANSGQIYSRIGQDRQKALLADLIKALRHNLRSSDFITFYDSHTLLMSMNDIPSKIAKNILKDITSVLERMLKKGLKGVEVQFVTDVRQINTLLSNELQIQQLVEDL
jgi:hypothetical protein